MSYTQTDDLQTAQPNTTAPPDACDEQTVQSNTTALSDVHSVSEDETPVEVISVQELERKQIDLNDKKVRDDIIGALRSKDKMKEFGGKVRKDKNMKESLVVASQSMTISRIARESLSDPDIVKNVSSQQRPKKSDLRAFNKLQNKIENGGVKPSNIKILLVTTSRVSKSVSLPEKSKLARFIKYEVAPGIFVLYQNEPGRTNKLASSLSGIHIIGDAYFCGKDANGRDKEVTLDEIKAARSHG